MKNILIFFTILSLLPGCSLFDPLGPKSKGDTNANGEIVELEPLWTFDLHELEPTSNSIAGAHLVYDNKVMFGTTQGENNRFLSCVDVATGKRLWKWNDVFNPIGAYYDIDDAFFHNGTMTYGEGDSRYAIDMATGKTRWKVQLNKDIYVGISGFDDTYFLVGATQDTFQGYQTYSGYRGSVSAGDGVTQFLITDIDSTTGGVDNLITTAEKIESLTVDGHRYLAVISSDPYPNWNYNVFYGLYDYDTGQWLYNRKLVSEPSQANSGAYIEYFENKVYVSGGNKIACFDFSTGERLWRHEFPLDFLFSGFIVREGMVVANCSNGILYGVDAVTGQEKWTAEGAGTGSRLQERYLNGVVYYSGGTGSNLHAVDIQNGKKLWRLEASRFDKGSEDFKPELYVVPGINGQKGRIVGCTHNMALCFEAAR